MSTSPYPRLLRFTLCFIALVQLSLGLGFLVTPETTAQVLGLPAVPGWANWMFGMMGARFLGYAYGMLLAARDPLAARPWIISMLFIQLADWGVTMKFVIQGAVTLAQVSTASFLPLVFVLLILITVPRATAKA